ncbi:Indole-3-glycerol phosphate synthase [uncultured archaeon]|nr:Indole-3-glycerol phosphate synthase [uncultured archaeon]
MTTARPGGNLLLPNRSHAGDMMERLSVLTPTAMSIWVEPRHMAGDLRWLARERPFPLISKDFVLDARQIVGGDAIVLSRSLLALAGVDEHPLIEAAHDLDMEVVMEVRTAEEMAQARQSEADVISIHNAGANGGGLDINTTLYLLSQHRTTRPVISSLGVHTPSQARQIISAGATAIELDAEICAGPTALDVIAGLKRAVNGHEPAAGPKNEMKTS